MTGHGFSNEQVEMIGRQICGNNLTRDELSLFLHTAKELGLSPITKQIYAVKRKGKMAIQTGIDGFRAIARRDGLAGISDAVYEGEKEIEFQVYGKDMSRVVPLVASVTVKRWGRGDAMEEYSASAHWDSYYPGTRGGDMWHKFPELMLAKCAEALALRKGFSGISGIYTDEEMAQADAGGSPAPKADDNPEAAEYAEMKSSLWELWQKYCMISGVELKEIRNVMAEVNQAGFSDPPTLEQLDYGTIALEAMIDDIEEAGQ